MASGTQNMTTYVAKRLNHDAQKTTAATLDAFNNVGTLSSTYWNSFNETDRASASYPGVSNGIILGIGWQGSGFGAQIAIDDDPTWFMALRQRNGDGWKAWKRIPMGDGTGASGNWGINITGSAATLITARTLTIGATGKTFNGSANVSWNMNEIMGSSDSTKFYRGDKTWSNTLTSNLVVNGDIEDDTRIIGNCNQYGLDMYARPFAHHATNPSSTNGGNLYYAAGNKDYYNSPRWCFAQYSYTASSTATNGHYETYRLPATAAGLTANATYEIRTSKSSAYTVDNATSASTCTGNSYGLLSNNTSQAAESCYDDAPGLHFWRYNGSSGQSGADGWIAQWSWGANSVGGQIYLDDNPSYTMMIRGRNNDENHTFNAWKRIQLCDGTGASGTWGISITGNAATATKATQDGSGNVITSKYVTLDTDQTNITGIKRFTKAVQCYRYTTNNNLPAITMDKPGSNYVGIGADGTNNRIKFGPCSSLDGAAWVAQSSFNSNQWFFQGSIYGTSSLTLEGSIVMGAGCRIESSSGVTYLGHSNNSSWVNTQDICSHSGSDKWKIVIAGRADFTSCYGAVWNDYAEMRKVPEAQINIEIIKEEKGTVIERSYPYAGRCVNEIGDGSMLLTTKRLQKGCKIISDTFGFCIGETEDCKTPIAVTGRVLAYPYENIEEYKNHIGDCVCSGPNGTISIMTSKETIQHPECIVGTISEIPTYAIWHCGNKDTKPISVNGRIWIYVR